MGFYGGFCNNFVGFTLNLKNVRNDGIKTK
jgi:hypothetical protein